MMTEQDQRQKIVDAIQYGDEIVRSASQEADRLAAELGRALVRKPDDDHSASRFNVHGKERQVQGMKEMLDLLRRKLLS